MDPSQTPSESPRARSRRPFSDVFPLTRHDIKRSDGELVQYVKGYILACEDMLGDLERMGSHTDGQITIDFMKRLIEGSIKQANTTLGALLEP